MSVEEENETFFIRVWIVRSHVGWGGEQNILYKGVETSP